jgi:hypothetical protein
MEVINEFRYRLLKIDFKNIPRWEKNPISIKSTI